MFKSNFFALFSTNCRKNIFNDSYDISFTYSLKNIFFRDIDNQGSVYSDGKYHLAITGKGVLSCFNEHGALHFFSSEFFTAYQPNARDFLVTFNNDQNKDLIFENSWNLFFKNEVVDYSDKEFGFPILKMCLVSKVIKNSFWSLELIEK